jgi:hypothetical protein
MIKTFFNDRICVVFNWKKFVLIPTIAFNLDRGGVALVICFWYIWFTWQND